MSIFAIFQEIVSFWLGTAYCYSDSMKNGLKFKPKLKIRQLYLAFKK